MKILAVDIGTGSLKAGLFGAEGVLESSVRIPYASSPGVDGEGFDAFLWEDAFIRALRQLSATRLSALAISGNGPSLVPCDSKGVPLDSALLWLQNRAVFIDGQPSYYLPKAAWLARHARGVWERTRLILSCPEWLHFRLTGRPTMVIPHEAFRPYVWDEKQIQAYGLDRRIFPETVLMGTQAGRVSDEAATRTGLPAGLPVAPVGSDFMAALLGSGATEPGMVCDRAGTSEGINYCSKTPSEDGRLRSLPHVAMGLWNTAAILSSTGAVFEWYRDITGQSARPYDETLAEVDAVDAGRDAPIFFPGHWGDRLWEFGGGSFHYLHPSHGRPEMGRAVMEAIGFAVRRGIEIIEESGLPVREMRVCGGQARGDVWNQMKADITGRPLLIPEIEDAELAGCAVCADMVLGRAQNLLEGSRSYVRISRVMEPRRTHVRRYDEAYERYRDVAGSLSLGNGRNTSSELG